MPYERFTERDLGRATVALALALLLAIGGVAALARAGAGPAAADAGPVAYVDRAQIDGADQSQMGRTDGRQYYCWYDWDRDSGRVYIVTRSQGQVVDVTPAYGQGGLPLYVRLD